ncbi:hypothetical protein I302_107511 [Kwoniella bestiolae CBS 10118]|uniref:Uncharacterized protein n=1 Tax=Kwoniella bestiolae CBS 10118 TaxID=1296100 RepID=A0AAJ8KDX2_9TREE
MHTLDPFDGLVPSLRCLDMNVQRILRVHGHSTALTLTQRTPQTSPDPLNCISPPPPESDPNNPHSTTSPSYRLTPVESYRPRRVPNTRAIKPRPAPVPQIQPDPAPIPAIPELHLNCEAKSVFASNHPVVTPAPANPTQSLVINEQPTGATSSSRSSRRSSRAAVPSRRPSTRSSSQRSKPIAAPPKPDPPDPPSRDSTLTPPPPSSPGQDNKNSPPILSNWPARTLLPPTRETATPTKLAVDRASSESSLSSVPPESPPPLPPPPPSNLFNTSTRLTRSTRSTRSLNELQADSLAPALPDITKAPDRLVKRKYIKSGLYSKKNKTKSRDTKLEPAQTSQDQNLKVEGDSQGHRDNQINYIDRPDPPAAEEGTTEKLEVNQPEHKSEDPAIEYSPKLEDDVGRESTICEESEGVQAVYTGQEQAVYSQNQFETENKVEQKSPDEGCDNSQTVHSGLESAVESDKERIDENHRDLVVEPTKEGTPGASGSVSSTVDTSGEITKHQSPTLEAFFPLPPKPELPPWRRKPAPISRGTLQRAEITRQSTRIALRSASTTDPPVPAEDLISSGYTSSTVDSVHPPHNPPGASTSAVPDNADLVSAIERLPNQPVKVTNQPSPVSTAPIPAIATDDSFTMSSLPKRQTRKPSRFQSQSPPPSAPTPKHSALTPEHEGFSDTSLTPPPLPQEPPSDHLTVKEEIFKKGKGKAAKVLEASVAQENNEQNEVAVKGKGKAKELSPPGSEGVAKVSKKKGRQLPKHVPLGISDQTTQSSSTPNTEGSASPSKITLKLNIGKASHESTPGPSAEAKPDQRQDDKPGMKKGKGKKRKSESVEPDLSAQAGDEGSGGAKRLKLKIKPVKESPTPAPNPVSDIQKGEDIVAGDDENRDQKPKTKNVEPEESIVKVKSKGRKVVRNHSSSESDEEEEKVRKPKKKLQRVIKDEDESMDESEQVNSKPAMMKRTAPIDQPKSKGIPPLSAPTSPGKPAPTADLPQSGTERQPSTSPERKGRSKFSPAPASKPVKKKARPSEPSSEATQKKAPAKGPDTPINKSEGLARSKSSTQLVPEEGGSSKKPFPAMKKSLPPSKVTAGPSGTPNAKPSGHGIGLLGNTLALLQGTGGTPKAKDTSKKDGSAKDKKDSTGSPQVTKRRGGWADEWVLTPEQEKEYAASKGQREAERKKREEWRKNPVNLQEAKDIYKVDSMQPRTIAVPGAMGIQTSGKPSEVAAALLGY